MLESDLEPPDLEPSESDESWQSAVEDPTVLDLAERMARRSGGRSSKYYVSKLGFMARTISLPGVLAVAREPLDENELSYSAVVQRVRIYADKHTPKWTYCSGGATSLEITPNGFYGRCSKTGIRREYMGDIRDEGPLKVFNPERDDLTCTIPCKKMMCFRNNVIRATDYQDFAHKVGQQGLRGNYNPTLLGYHSKIFIRWKVTDVCNYTCAYCCDWRTVNAKGVEVTDDEMMAAAARMVSQFDGISMRLTGGEPSSRKRYVDLMRLFHDNLDRFSDLEIRTNLSFQTKHQEVLSWDWKGKLLLHIGCHIRDKNFMPWRMVEVLKGAPNVKYELKFVSLPSIRPHIDFFIRYFVDNGIPSENIKVVEENSGRKDVKRQIELEEAPKARKYLEERWKPTSPDVGAYCKWDAPAKPNPVRKPVDFTATRFSIGELRAMKRKTERRVISADVDPPPGYAPLPETDWVVPREDEMASASNGELRASKRKNGERQTISADLDPPLSAVFLTEAAAVPAADPTPITEAAPSPPAAPTAMTQIRRVIIGLSGPDRIAFSARVVRALVRRAKARLPAIGRPSAGNSAGMESRSP
ncbi:MAG TPA: radical SAM protein [Rhizomicrobium sp.]|nr:radical SAM protein [Rhizomicrobium sp.]